MTLLPLYSAGSWRQTWASAARHAAARGSKGERATPGRACHSRVRTLSFWPGHAIGPIHGMVGALVLRPLGQAILVSHGELGGWPPSRDSREARCRGGNASAPPHLPPSLPFPAPPPWALPMPGLPLRQEDAERAESLTLSQHLLFLGKGAAWPPPRPRGEDDTLHTCPLPSELPRTTARGLSHSCRGGEGSLCLGSLPGRGAGPRASAPSEGQVSPEQLSNPEPRAARGGGPRPERPSDPPP